MKSWIAAVLPWLAVGVLGSQAELARGESAPAADGDVLAQWDGGRITRVDYEQVLAAKLPQERVQIAKPGGREKLLESLIRYDLLAAEAERRGYGNDYDVQQAARRTAIEHMLAERIRVDPAAIPAAEVEPLYAAQARNFGRPHMRRATHIQVASEAEAKQLIRELSRAEREQFARVARERNIDPHTKHQGGELGYFDVHGETETGRPAQVPMEIVAKVFKLRRVGEVAREPVAHDGAFSVVMLTGEMEAVVKPRDEIEAELREQLAKRAEAKAVDALVEELRAAAKPEVHAELVDAIELPPGQPLDIPEGFAAAPPDPRQPPTIVPPDKY
ncbi:MAG TPA: peptidyl-prolyl cis-trans isomerase [Polyangiales bacterium]|nr:peptidyl-prolyl cis-trans isomerase [Polyangiales bacterium]